MSITTRKKQPDPLSPKGVTKGVTSHQKKKKKDPLLKNIKKTPSEPPLNPLYDPFVALYTWTPFCSEKTPGGLVLIIEGGY
jgi:hypothetical protein